MTPRHLASRAGRWSARHRKHAILGWTVFVVLATVAGSMIGTTELEDAEQGNGSSRAADLAADRAGFRDTSGEQVLLQARTPAAQAQLRQASAELGARLKDVAHVEKVVSPYDAGAGPPDLRPGAGRIPRRS